MPNQKVQVNESVHYWKMNKYATVVTLIKLVAILEHGDTTVLRHLS